MTRVLVAFDKFKDALTARRACEAAAQALRAKHPDWNLDLCPLTDGGEGFAETLTQAVNGHNERHTVAGPRDDNVAAGIGFVRSDALPKRVQHRLQLTAGKTLAVIGLASTSGLELLSRDQRDPWHTTTTGLGELIAVAKERSADAVLIGIGGSATNDLGLGALSALGLKCLKADGSFVVTPTPATWSSITKIINAVKLPRIIIACDVTNPLLGPRGATVIFGPQKGLVPADIQRLEADVARMAAMLCAACNQPFIVADQPGAGAAGGFGFGFSVATGAEIVPGFELVSDWLDLETRVAAADLVLTGEGRFDATSLGGKGPGSLVAMARRSEKPIHVFAGSLGLPEDGYHHAVTPASMPLPEALPRTAELLAAALARTF